MVTDKVVGTYTVVKDVTATDVNTVMVNAIEGGIGYWAGMVRDSLWDDKPAEDAPSEWAAKILLNGGIVRFYDKEEGADSFNFALTLDKLIKGIQMNAKQRPYDTDLEYGDAITYDCIIQYALFDEIVFG